MPEIRSLRSVSAKLATFPMCAFNAPWQKYTTVMYSSGFDEWLDPLDRLTCTHTKHQRVAGGAVGENGTPSSETSAYPTDFNHYLARAVLSLARPSRALTRVAPEGSTLPTAIPRLILPWLFRIFRHHQTQRRRQRRPRPCPSRRTTCTTPMARKRRNRLLRQSPLEAPRRRAHRRATPRRRAHLNSLLREAPAHR